MIKHKKLLFSILGILAILFAFVSIIGDSTSFSAFTASSKVGVNAECASFSDKFKVEIYDGNTLISEENIEFDKEYTVKVYNESQINCDYYLTTEGTELNSFSNYVSIVLTEDHSYNTSLASTSSIRSGVRLNNANKQIINVKSFSPSNQPMIYTLKISTDSVKLVAQNAPDRLVDYDFDLKLSFIASTTAK